MVQRWFYWLWPGNTWRNPDSVETCMNIHATATFLAKYICKSDACRVWSHVITKFLSPSRVPEPLLFLCLLPLPFSRANWKTSVIILVLAQIWRDQRWPAGRGRTGADGCMLRGEPGEGPLGFNTSSPLGAPVCVQRGGMIRIEELTWSQWYDRRASTAPPAAPLAYGASSHDGSDLRKINSWRAVEGKSDSVGRVQKEELIQEWTEELQELLKLL